MSLTDEKGTPGGFVCLVDGDGNYNLEQERMDELIDHIDPKKDGSYTIVGIMGCQSTGKSTLLNRLFGTQFAMMNETVRRGQTTKGIWLDAARNTNNLMIADLEGTDSGERGEDRTTFERQTILYALAICEVLIINMWETDIGRYTASNHGILKTVFEVNMQLFKSKTKTQLLFIIRDYNEDGTPFSTLRSRLLKEMQGIWDEISKPIEFQNVAMTDCFDFKFSYLPHFIYRREKFEEMVKKLKEKFSDKNAPDSFFDTEYHQEKSKSIPSRDFAQYSESIWNTIRTNQDLNLPTQREMLATYRCDELISQILVDYHDAIAPWREKAMTTLCPSLGQFLSSSINAALVQYDTACSKYIQDVVQRKRIEFEKKLLEPVIEIVQLNMKLYVFNTLVQEYDNNINQDITQDEVSFGIMEICDSKLTQSLEKFNEMTNEMMKGLESYPSILTLQRDNLKEFTAKLSELRNILRKAQLHALVQTTLTEFDARFDAKVMDLFNDAKIDLWSKVGDLFTITLNQVFQSVQSELDSLADTEDEKWNTTRKIIESAEYILFDKAQRFVMTLPVKMRDRFESLFVYHKGLLRQWKGSDDPRAIFEQARDDSIQLLKAFTNFSLRQNISPQYLKYLTSSSSPSNYNNNGGQLTDQDENAAPVNGTFAPGLLRVSSVGGGQPGQPGQSQPQSLTTSFSSENQPSNMNNNTNLISRDDVYRIESEFERKIQGHLQNAILEVERIRTQTGLPPWIYALLLFLGYDELLWALSNPFILFFLLLAGIGIFALHQLHMLDAVTKILVAVGNRLLTEVTSAIDPGSTNQQQAQQAQNKTTPGSTTTQPPSLNRQGTTTAGITSTSTPPITSTSTTQIPPAIQLERYGSGIVSDTDIPTATPQSTTLSLDLSQLPDDFTQQKDQSSSSSLQQQQTSQSNTITPLSTTPRRLNTPTNFEHSNNLSTSNTAAGLKRRPNFGTMTMNKRGMAQLYSQGLEAGFKGE